MPRGRPCDTAPESPLRFSRVKREKRERRERREKREKREQREILGAPLAQALNR